MSTRTIIEINHDWLHDLEQMSCDSLRTLLRRATDCNAALNASGARGVEHGCGVRTLGTRHHSEDLDVVVSGYAVYAESDSARKRA